MMRFTYIMCLCAGLPIVLHGCRTPEPRETPAAPEADPMLSVNTLLPEPEGFLAEQIGSDDYPIPPYAKFLEGVKICLDPGHGGDAHKRAYKRGPTGVREAEFNLRVAKFLRALLTEAGAEVLLTREQDEASSLAERAAIANEWGADLFISLHHNAIGGKPQVNRTTVWYHNDVDYRPSNLDLARYLCYGLYDSIALPQITGIPLHSDQLMYDSGFGILRHADVTAALTESSFFTNPDEEQRLRTPEYNLLEAYGLFVGLAKYTAAGLPRAYLIEPEDGVIVARGVIPRSSPEANDEESGSEEGSAPPPRVENGQSEEVTPPPNALVFELDDGLRARKSWGADRQMILTDSITVHLDGQRVPHAFSDDGRRYLLTVSLPADLAPGQHAVDVQFQNMHKNSVLNPHFLVRGAETEDLPGGQVRIPSADPVVALWDAGIYLLGTEPHLVTGLWKDGTVVAYTGNAEAVAGEPATQLYEIGTVSPAHVTEVMDVVKNAGFFEPPIPEATLEIPDGPLRALVVDDGDLRQIWRFHGDESCVHAIGPNASPSRAEVQAFIETWGECVNALNALSPTPIGMCTGPLDIAYLD